MAAYLCVGLPRFNAEFAETAERAEKKTGPNTDIWNSGPFSARHVAGHRARSPFPGAEAENRSSQRARRTRHQKVLSKSSRSETARTARSPKMTPRIRRHGSPFTPLARPRSTNGTGQSGPTTPARRRPLLPTRRSRRWNIPPARGLRAHARSGRRRSREPGHGRPTTGTVGSAL
jgi:hypothetical protein